MKTYEEIVKRIEQKIKEPFDFQHEVLLPYLPFEHVKQFFKPEVIEEVAKSWEVQPLTREFVLEEAKTYMEKYGWPKCQDHRGISAGRTVDKMITWTWLLDDDDFVEVIERMLDTSYAQYGAPILKRICEQYDWPIPDDKETKRMMDGLPCAPNCDMGCGR